MHVRAAGRVRVLLRVGVDGAVGDGGDAAREGDAACRSAVLRRTRAGPGHQGAHALPPPLSLTDYVCLVPCESRISLLDLSHDGAISNLLHTFRFTHVLANLCIVPFSPEHRLHPRLHVGLLACLLRLTCYTLNPASSSASRLSVTFTQLHSPSLLLVPLPPGDLNV
eukprot:3783130-Pleurochrysis_carterae.AAC.1